MYTSRTNAQKYANSIIFPIKIHANPERHIVKPHYSRSISPPHSPLYEAKGGGSKNH